MRDENEFDYGEDEVQKIVQKYEYLLRQNKTFFFDISDFEYIIDYYLYAEESRKALEAIEIAGKVHPNSSEILSSDNLPLNTLNLDSSSLRSKATIK